jgi:hypothetical protein
MGDDCLTDPQTVPYRVDLGRTVEMWPHRVGGRSWWFASVDIEHGDTSRACEALDATLFIPTGQRDWGTALHFASLSAAAGAEGKVWTGLRFEVDLRALVDTEGAVVLPWLPARPPHPGQDDDSAEATILDALASGDREDIRTCVSFSGDGAMRIEQCSADMSPLCQIPDSPDAAEP